MVTPQKLAATALAVAVGSSFLAAYAVLSTAPAPVGASVCECDESRLRAELAELSRRVEAAERQVQQDGAPGGVAHRSRVVDGEVSRGETAVGDDLDKPSGGQPALHPVEIESPRPGVSVTQTASGALSVRNTDPSLVGQVLTVSVRGEDGTARDVPITVPPIE